MKQRLLVLDDEKGLLAVMEIYFRAQGWEVDCTAEREEAEALLSKHNYSAVVTDLYLSPTRQTDGLTLTQFIKYRCPQICVVVLTAHGSPEIQTAARNAGVDAFLEKPLTLPALAGTLRGLMERQSCNKLHK